MSKYFLISNANEYFEIGSLIKYEDTNVTPIDNNRSQFPIYRDFVIQNDWIELSARKMMYLSKRKINKRIEIHHSQLFEKIEHLKTNDVCYVIDGRYRERCSIINKVNDSEFIVKMKNRVIKRISIEHIDLIVNIQYYLCLNQCGGIKVGMIVIEEDGARSTYPEGYFVCNYIDTLTEICRDEANFLSRFPCEERLNLHNEQLWASIECLTVGDRCCLVAALDHPSYQIIGREYRENTVEYIVQSVVGYMVCVDQSEIRPEKSIAGFGAYFGGKPQLGTIIDHTEDNWMSVSSVAMSIDNSEQSLRSKTKYFDLTVINPWSVITIEITYTEEWVKDTNVEFRLGESCKKYSGELIWTGLINKIFSAIIRADEIGPDDPLRHYLCSREFCDNIDIAFTDNLVIVLLATVNKVQSVDEQEYVKSVFDYINRREMNVELLMDMIDKEDTRVLKYLLKEWKHPINLEHYPELLPTLIGQNNYDVISILLDNLITSHNDCIQLLNIAKYFVINGQHAAFICASKKCTDANVRLHNGETLLTSVIKDCDDEGVINRVIDTGLFDINKTNNDGETPLVLVCRKLMVSSVRLLLSNEVNASYENNLALDTVTDLRNMTSDTTKLHRALEIIAIFKKEIRLDHNMCSICMDRRIKMALNCGHTMCDVCAIELIRCPECYQDITCKTRIFLP